VPQRSSQLNWLAHVYLSEPAVEFRLGNLLADLVRGEERLHMPADFIRGAQRHKAIDAFTDAHPIVRQSRLRISPHYRRFSGVLMDIFYDYFLARHWLDYSAEPLATFTASFYEEVKQRTLPLPEPARATLDRIVAHDLLGQYSRIDGVEHSLRRVSTYLAKRWRRDFQLAASVQELIEHEAEFAADFAGFFPKLREHVASLERE
jgi:acyl carrier protein phosphodiesterase